MEQNNLADWLTHERADEFFGTSFSLKFNVLALLASRTGTQADIARRFGVSEAYVSKVMAKAREVYGIGMVNRGVKS